MVALRHAALHAREQKIVWQQIFIGPTEYVWRLIEVKLPPMKRTNPSQPKSRCLLLRFLRGRRGFRRGSRRAGEQRRRLYCIELGPAFIKVGLSLLFDLRLVGTGVVAVLVIEHFDHLHSVAFYHAERRESHAVEARVLLEIDEHLRGARVRPSGRKRDVPLLVALCHWIIFNVGSLPGRSHGRIRANPKLRDKARHNTEDASAVKEMMLDEIVEAVSPERRPDSRDVEVEFAARGHEPYLVLRWRSVLEQRRPQQRAVKGAHGGGRFLRCAAWPGCRTLRRCVLSRSLRPRRRNRDN